MATEPQLARELQAEAVGAVFSCHPPSSAAPRSTPAFWAFSSPTNCQNMK
jgi:hypothetical protein